MPGRLTVDVAMPERTTSPSAWPTSAEDLRRRQEELARSEPPPWRPIRTPELIAGCFACFPRNHEGIGAAGDPEWAAAVLLHDRVVVDMSIVRGEADAPYEPGLLALREGPLLERAVRGLDTRPEVLLVNASGRDHQRKAGLALHLGAVLDLPTVGVTHRPLIAVGRRPIALHRGATSPVTVDDEIVGKWVRTRWGVRPVVAHAAWRTDPDTAAWLVLETSAGARTPAPLREARRLARTARAVDR